jgi:hypothetical protein
MSTLQVANVFFDASGNNKITYEANTITFLSGSQEVFSNNRIANVITSVPNVESIAQPIASYRFSANSTAPAGYISVVNSVYSVATYPDLGDLLNVSPYADQAGGEVWVDRISSNTSRFQEEVAYGNGVFVSVGESGFIQTSTDGISWTRRTAANSNTIYGITYGSSEFVAVGGSGSVQTSTDGITWTNRTSVGNTNIKFAVAYSAEQNLYVAVGFSGSITSSTNGITWTNRTSGTSALFDGIAYGNGTWVAAGNAVIRSSTNAITWTSRTSQSSVQQREITYSSEIGIFVSVGDNGNIQTSTDGVTWTLRTSANTADIAGVRYGNGYFVAVGGSGSVQTSTDGITWTNRTRANTQFQKGIAYGNGIFVSSGNNGSIQSSSPTVSYNTSTEFKTPPFNYNFSPYDNGYGQNVYIYMKT